MNLDDLEHLRVTDPSGMLGHIDSLPGQLAAAWDLGQSLPLPAREGIRQVLVCGMGGSAIGGDLVAAYTLPAIQVPLIVWRGYDLPAYVTGPETLVVASSHSGNTEEVLSAFDRARKAGARLVALTTGGQLARRAEAAGVPLWRFEHTGQPRTAVGFSFGLLLAVLARLGLIPNPAAELADAVAAMHRQQEALRAEVPVVRNPAKRMAGQWVERWPTIIGSDLLAPVARRWRTQISELAKAIAQFEELPEADHNLVAGVLNPEALSGKTMVVFLQASLNHPRNRLRIEATRKVLMIEGFNTDVVQAAGETRMAQQWTSLHFGDYSGYYLAMAYGVDPTPVAAIESLKQRLTKGEA
jgi:glucose/mannose-6-phosphate isomerase